MLKFYQASSAADARILLALAKACAEDLTEKHGLGHHSGWCKLPAYRNRIKKKLVYIGTMKDIPVVTFTLDIKKPGFVSKYAFAEPEDSFYWLTSLFVDPQFQRQGVGRKTLEYAEKLTKQANLNWLRFDAYTGPAGGGPFYEKCGFTNVSEIDVRGTGLYLFEKKC